MNKGLWMRIVQRTGEGCFGQPRFVPKGPRTLSFLTNLVPGVAPSR